MSNDLNRFTEQVGRDIGALREVYTADIPLTGDWRSDIGSEVTAYRSGNVVTVASWRLGVIEGTTGEVAAYTLPPGYRPAGLTQQYTRDSRGADVALTYDGTATLTDPSGLVAHHSFTFVTLDPPPSE